MDNEYLIRCIVDPMNKMFYLYSNLGTKKEVYCKSINQFIKVLEVVRTKIKEDLIEYKNPL
jgi:hypothetical protein